MGIQGQASILFKSKEIGLDDLIYLLDQHYVERKRSQLTSRACPKVTIDASLLGYKFLGTSLHPSNGVFLVCTILASRNIDVLLICDPPTRHHSKRAHQLRVGKKEKAKLMLMLCRMELSRVRDSNDMVGKLTSEIRKLEKAVGQAFLPEDFITKLQAFVTGYSANGKGELSIEISPFQADPSIANVALLGGCEAIISGDSDFSMYIGPGGPDNLGDIQIRDIKVNQKQSTITSCLVVTGQTSVAQKVEELLSNRGLVKVFKTTPKFQLFNGVDIPKIRA